MRFYLNNLVSLVADYSANPQDEWRLSKDQLLDLSWIKAAQRRRLSSYAKMVLGCAYQSHLLLQSGDIKSALPTIFSTRHGDIHKTTSLLTDLAASEPLSPTAFSLSVHNAVAGMFTIFTENIEASNTISAGRETLLMALVDGYARLKSGLCSQVLIVHCDEALPEAYVPYKDEQQIDHALAFVMSLEPLNETAEAIELSSSKGNDVELNGKLQLSAPIALAFLEWLQSQSDQVTFDIAGRRWHANKVNS